MAAKKTKRKSSKRKPAPRVFYDCGDPKGCAVRRPAGRRAASPPGFTYTTKDKPCRGGRASCPVQLVYKKGQPMLRFCHAKNKPGDLVPFRSVEQARKSAQDLCRCWTRSSKDPKKRSFDSCSALKKLSVGLGKPTRRRRRK